MTEGWQRGQLRDGGDCVPPSHILLAYLWLFLALSNQEKYGHNTSDLMPQECLTDNRQLHHAITTTTGRYQIYFLCQIYKENIIQGCEQSLQKEWTIFTINHDYLYQGVFMVNRKLTNYLIICTQFGNIIDLYCYRLQK